MTQQGRSGPIRDSLAALGVVVSLLFVGYEIRQNTQVARAAAIQATADQSLQVIIAWAADEQAVRLMTRLLDGALPSEFSDDENTKLRFMFLATFRIMENRYRQSDLGLIDDPMIFTGRAAIYRSPYLAARWDEFRSAVVPDFAEQFEVDFGLR